MTPAPRAAVTVLGAGVALGALADVLLRATPWGVNLTLWIAAVLGAGAALARRWRVAVAPETPWLALAALLLAAGFVGRDAEELQVLTVLGLAGTLGTAAWAARGAAPRQEGVAAWLRAWAAAARDGAVGVLLLILRDIPWARPDAARPLRLAPAIAAGVLLAAPLLVVFGALFASADAVFATLLDRAFRPETLAPHVVALLAGTAFAAGALRHALLGRCETPAAESSGPHAAYVPVVTALALVCTLFLLFVIVQLRYLFGGASLVRVTAGLTWAEYARRGFSELVVASALVLPLLVAAEWAVRRETAARHAWFRGLAAVLLALVAVIVASGLERMRLYVAAFGLTTARIYATAAEVALLGVLAWFAWTVLRGHHRRFAAGAFLIGLAVLGGLHALDPQAFAVRWNLARPATERRFDAAYATSLGADAAPLLAAALPRLTPADRCVIVNRLRAWGRGDADWRTWNLSRARARRLARAHAPAFDAVCPDPDRSPPRG